MITKPITAILPQPYSLVLQGLSPFYFVASQDNNNNRVGRTYTQ